VLFGGIIALEGKEFPRKGDMSRRYLLALAVLVGVVLFSASQLKAQTWAPGDTLTVIQRPLQNIPEIVVPGGVLTISCAADPGTTGWQASLQRGTFNIPLQLASAQYDTQTMWWRLTAAVPEVPVFGLYDLRVAAAGVEDDLARQSVKVQAAFPEDFYFVHITDTHLPTYLYYDQSGADTDSSTTVSLRHITRDVNLINPAFVLLTGDLINEGELEDFLDKRYYSRAQRQLREFQVPVFLTAGNHDIGGWNDTPPSDGTARRDWWRFFGWRILDDPPPGADLRTQNYSFDYGPVHFTGLEAYDNYDRWRLEHYGYESFTEAQLDWLQQDLAATDRQVRVLFHHYDFQNELNLGSLGLDMALSGHIHHDVEDSSWPFDVSTDNAGGTNRPFRLVRFSGGQLSTQPSLEAGYDGQTMTTTYLPDDSGTHDLVRVTVANGYSQTFEHGLVKVAMPAGAQHFRVQGGTLVQVDRTGDFALCHVAASLTANASTVVTVTVDDAAPAGGDLQPVTRLLGAHPNPFNPRTNIGFELAEAGHCRVTIYDLKGQVVAGLVDTYLEAGQYSPVWQGVGPDGQALPSGIYLVGLRTDSYSETRKMTLVR
jgi:hypothetical protein